MSGVQPSEETVERIFDMTKESKKKKIRLAPVVALAVCVTILVAGIFGSSAITAKLNTVISQNNTEQTIPPANNFFTITAYAKDNDNNEKKVDLCENKIIKTSLELKKDGSDAVTMVTYFSFMVEGKEIEKVTYLSKRGSFDYQSLNGNDFKAKRDEIAYDSNYPYASQITIENIGDKEVLAVLYKPEEAIDALFKTDEVDYSRLPSDTITVSVTFKNGSKAEKKIKTSFDKEGCMQMEYVE